MAHLVEGPVQVEHYLGKVPPECGAMTVFAGTVRCLHLGREVTGIRYHAYVPLAEKRLQELESDTARRFGVHCRLVHATGELVVGQVSVLVLVYGPHRQEAFEACRYAIDTLKQTVPIWKEERFANGASAFVDGSPLSTILAG